MNTISAILMVSDGVLAAGVRRTIAEMPVRVLVDEPSFEDWNEFCSRAEPLGPDVLILEYGLLRDTIEATMDRVNRMPVPPAVIVVHTEAQADTILRVMRAGAREYCNPPVEKPLAAALEKILRFKIESGPVRGGGKVYGLVGAKGGCGVTTLAVHAAISLPSGIDGKVLLADMDLGGGMVEFLLKCKVPYSVVQAMQNAHRLDTNYWNALVSNGIPRLDVLVGPPATGRPVEMPVVHLSAVLRFARSMYAATVVDLGRFLTPASLSVREELDQLLLVTTLDVLALHQARKMMEALLDVGFPRDRMGLIVNRVTNQRDIEPDDVEKLLGVSLVSVLPDDPTSIHDAYPEGKTLAADSRLYQHIARMARKMAGVPETQQKKKFLFFGS